MWSRATEKARLRIKVPNCSSAYPRRCRAPASDSRRTIRSTTATVRAIDHAEVATFAIQPLRLGYAIAVASAAVPSAARHAASRVVGRTRRNRCAITNPVTRFDTGGGVKSSHSPGGAAHVRPRIAEVMRPEIVRRSDRPGVKARNCTVCLGPLPKRDEPRGRPRVYCGLMCKERNKRLGQLRGRAEAREREGRADVAARIRTRVDVNLRIPGVRHRGDGSVDVKARIVASLNQSSSATGALAYERRTVGVWDDDVDSSRPASTTSPRTAATIATRSSPTTTGPTSSPASATRSGRAGSTSSPWASTRAHAGLEPPAIPLDQRPLQAELDSPNWRQHYVELIQRPDEPRVSGAPKLEGEIERGGTYGSPSFLDSHSGGRI
jgi:hypothetical protein